jgi:hypothetical protein
MEAVYFSETLLLANETILWHNQGDYNMNLHSREYLISQNTSTESFSLMTISVLSKISFDLISDFL